MVAQLSNSGVTKATAAPKNILFNLSLMTRKQPVEQPVVEVDQGQSEFVRVNLRTNKIVVEDETWNGEEEMEVANSPEEGEPPASYRTVGAGEEEDSSTTTKKKKKKKKKKKHVMEEGVEGREEVLVDGIPADIVNEKGRYECEVCEVNCTSEAGYELHLAGTKHQRKMTKLTDKTDQILDRPNKSFPVRIETCKLCEVHCSIHIMAPPRLDPWRNQEEWRMVYDLLYSPHHPDITRGLSFLTLWKLRSPRLPLAVECTGELVRASLELGDTNSIISTYSLAIIRFVNGYTDKAQAGLFARPTLALGSSLGIPEWIVYMRHDATHKSLPTLREARAAAQFALSWLRSQYWDAQVEHVAIVTDKSRDMLERYVELQGRVEGKLSKKGELSELIERMCSQPSYEMGILIESIVERCLVTDNNKSVVPLLNHLRRVKPVLFDEIWVSLTRHYNPSTSTHLRTLFSEFYQNDLLPCREPLRESIVRALLRVENTPETRELCQKLLAGISTPLERLLNITTTSTQQVSEEGDQVVGLLRRVVERCRKGQGSCNNKRFTKCHVKDWEGVPLGSLPYSDVCYNSDMVVVNGDVADGVVQEKKKKRELVLPECTPVVTETSHIVVPDVSETDTSVRGESISEVVSKLESLRKKVRLLDEE
eukprot:sb/3479435/